MDRESFEQLMEAGDFGNPVHSVPEWDKPIPFSNPNTPDFPVESLPGAVGAFVEQLAESTQTPEEMAGILSLGILATALQSRYEVQITPDWREPLCLYPVAVAPPGERKSAVISALSGPVYEYEAEQREFEAAEIAQNQTERVLLEKALQAAQNSAAKGNGNFEAKRALLNRTPSRGQRKNIKFLNTARQVCRAVGTEDLGTLLRQAAQIFGFLGG